MSIKYPLATFTWDEAEYQALQDVIASNMFTMGERVKAFEQQFAKQLGSKYALMVNSGSSANLLMVAALFYTSDPSRRLKPGDEVIVPAVSWSTTYAPLHQYGLRLRFVDIDLETLNIDVEACRRAVTANTKAILAVNLLGNPCDFKSLQAICSEYNLLLLEDNCESLGASLEGANTGAIGLVGAFSTFFSHHISTMEGGVVCTNDQELYEIMLCLRAHGWTRNLPENNLVSGQKSPDVFEESFKFFLPGYNLRPMEMQGALGLEQLKKLPNIIAQRRVNGAYWQKVMGQHPKFLIQREWGESSWFGFSLVIRPGVGLKRQDLLSKLRTLGFECRPIVTGNFVKNPVVKWYDYDVSESLHNADWIDANGLFIGNHHYPINEAIDTIASLT